MSESYDFNFFFLYKNDALVLSKVKTIIEDFQGVDFKLSLIQSNSENPKVGLKITAQSNKKFSVESSFTAEIKKKSKEIMFSNSGQFVFSNEHDTTIIYPGIVMSEVKDYLTMKNDKKVIEISLKLDLNIQNNDSKQKNKTENQSKAHEEKNYDKNTENDENDNHKSHRSKESRTDTKKDENKKTNSKNKDDEDNQNKFHKKSKSQLQLTKTKDYDYSDEKDGEQHQTHKNLTKSSTSKKTRRSTQSQVRTRKKNVDDYDQGNEYDSDKHSRREKSRNKKNDIEYETEDKKKNSIKSRKKQDEIEGQNQTHKSSKKAKEDNNQKLNNSKKKIRKETIEYSETDDNNNNEEPKKQKSSSRKKKDKFDSNEDNDQQKLESTKKKYQSQSQLAKRRKSVENFEKEGKSQKNHHQIKIKIEDNQSTKQKRRSKSVTSLVKIKEQENQEEKITAEKKKTKKSSKKNDETAQNDKKTTENEEQNIPKKRKTSKASKKNNENEKEGKNPTNSTTKKPENDSKSKKTPKKENNNNNYDDDENAAQYKNEKPTAKNDVVDDDENSKVSSIEKVNQKDDNHIITNETCPFIGLSNLGATCYMNSAIQVLFHTPLFRKNVLTYDSGIKDINAVNEAKDSTSKCKRILINLQYLFYQMTECMNQQSNHEQHKDYISTIQLTKSFGWNKQETSMQQDVHEFIINFFEVLDSCSKDQKENGYITDLFKGRIITSITNKKDGKLVLQSFEYFYDFSLLVKGNNDIYQSLNMYTEKDELKKGSNNQELIQVQFYSLPKVLHIHLRRFVYSQEHCRTDKVNDYFSFPEKLDMSPYVFNGNPKTASKKSKKKDDTKDNQEEIVAYKGECNYSLYGVIVHQGKMSYIGHYYAYMKLNPNFNERDYDSEKENWYLFNDTKVSKVTKEEAMTMNFGEKNNQNENENENESLDDSDFHCAYILLYVRNDAINEIFNIRNCDIKIPKNIISCIDSINNRNSTNNKSSNSFTNVSTNSTVGFTLITEDCVRMNCKLGKAGIDNRNLCKRVNVPFDQIFTFSNNSKNNDGFSVGGLYATVSIFLNIDLYRLKLWTVTSSYEIKEPLNCIDFEISKEMSSEEVERIKEKAISLISPRVIFVEVLKFENFENEENEETEETEESSSVTHHNTSIVTKLYTRETQCPMLYTGILSNLSYSHSLNSIIKHHYKKHLLELTCEMKNKDRKFCKSMIDRINFDVYYEKKKSNTKGNSDLFKLNTTNSLKSNNVPKGAFLIFSINSIKPSESTNNNFVDNEMIIRWVNDLINNDKSLNKNYEFITSNNNNKNDRSETVHRYCDMMLTECPSNPIDFCNLFTNTEIFNVYRYVDNSYFGKIELPNKLSINQLSDFIAFQFDIDYNSKESKMLFFGDGPALRPIESGNQNSGTASNDSVIFNITENIRKSFYFDIVPRTFKYNDQFFTLSVVFSEDSVSLTKKFNFFIETFLQEDEENNETEQSQKQTKNQNNKIVTAESFDNIVNKVIEKVYPNSKNSKNNFLNDLRCFWISKETGQIVSDFITINSKKKKNYIQENDILFLNRELRIEITPKEQMSEMKSIKKANLKSKNGNDYLGVRLEVYKSYVQDNYDGFDGNENENSLPLLKVFDFPFVLVNVDQKLSVKKLKEQIAQALSNSENDVKNDYLSIKYASLYIPPLDKNLFEKNLNESSNKNGGNDNDDDDYFENDEVNNNKNDKVEPASLIKNDYKFAFDPSLILKNDDKINLQKNQPNKLFLVYTQDRALGNANEGVVFL